MLAWAPECGWTLTCSAPGIEGEGALLGEHLGDVDELAAAVVALARQALGVLVRQPAALGLHDGRRDVVLAGDELDVVVLAAALALHRLPQLGVDLGDRLEREAARLGDGHDCPTPSCPDVRPTPTVPCPPARSMAIFPRTPAPDGPSQPS